MKTGVDDKFPRVHFDDDVGDLFFSLVVKIGVPKVDTDRKREEVKSANHASPHFRQSISHSLT